MGDNNETSKLFVSILDQDPDGMGLFYLKAHELEKMHELEPRKLHPAILCAHHERQ